MAKNMSKNTFLAITLGVSLFSSHGYAQACSRDNPSSCTDLQVCEMIEQSSSPRHKFLYESVSQNRGLNCSGILNENSLPRVSIDVDKEITGLNSDEIYNLGYKYYNEGDTLTAIALWERAAANNHHHSLQMLAYQYSSGEKVAKDMAKTAKYTKIMAEMGHVESMKFYGYQLANGVGVPQNIEKAHHYTKRAGDAGDKEAHLIWWELHRPIYQDTVNIHEGVVYGIDHDKDLFYSVNEISSTPREPIEEKGVFGRAFYSCKSVADPVFIETAYNKISTQAERWGMRIPNKEHCVISKGRVKKQALLHDGNNMPGHMINSIAPNESLGVWFLVDEEDYDSCVYSDNRDNCTGIYELEIEPYGLQKRAMKTPGIALYLEDKESEGVAQTSRASLCYDTNWNLLHDATQHYMNRINYIMDKDDESLFREVASLKNNIEMNLLDYRSIIKNDRKSLFYAVSTNKACSDYIRMENNKYKNKQPDRIIR